MKVFENCLVIGTEYYLSNAEFGEEYNEKSNRGIFVSCLPDEEGQLFNYFHPILAEHLYMESDGTVGFSMDDDDSYTYEEV